MSTDDYDMMSRMSSCGTTPKDMIYDIPLGVPSLEKIATSGNPATSDPNPEERSYADEVTEMYNVMLSLRSLNESSSDVKSPRDPFSMELSRLKSLVTNNEGSDAPPPEFSLHVLDLLRKDVQMHLAEVTTFSIGPQRRQIRELVKQQKLIASELKKNSSWTESYRTHVDNHGTMYVLKNDLSNKYMGKLEHEFLIKILTAPRKHCVWKEAADRILALPHPGEPPLVHEVLDILTKCLETTRLDQEKLHSLQDESCKQDDHLSNWLPHTISRILGENVKENAPKGEEKLRARFGKEAYMISRFLTDMRYEEIQRNTNFLAKSLKYVPPFTLLIPMLSLQQEDIEGEIEYLKKKVEYLRKNVENMDDNQD
ncbi:hypothetical protein J3E69DRAFT_375911 [Trichoderma sp. SZMC 28015]